MLLKLAIAAVFAFLITYFATPLVEKLALRLGAVDLPGGRKIHQRAVPRLGGLAIYLGFTLALLSFFPPLTLPFWGLLLGSTVILFLGFWDDLRGVSPLTKILGQVVAALVAVAFGVKMEFLTHPFDNLIFLGYLAIPFTLLWIVGITNALNLIDGLDGLAAGTAAIATFMLALAARIGGEATVVAPAVILIASALAFLRYNFYPARIFLGDTGSLLLGFYLATLSLLGLGKGVTFFSLIVPVFILGFPITDTAFAVWRRLRNQRPVFEADKEHLHHRLLARGFSQRQAVTAFYLLDFSLGAVALFLIAFARAQVVFLAVICLFLFFLGARKFKFKKRALGQQRAWRNNKKEA